MNISLKNLYRISYILKNLFKQKKQKWFYDLENYKNIVKFKKKTFYIFYNYIFDIENSLKINNFNKRLDNLFKEVILIFIPNYSKHFDVFNFKNKFYLFNYNIDKKNYNRKLFAGPNFLKIDLTKKKKISIKKKDKDICIKPFFIKKNSKKRLILLIMVDGLGADLLTNFKKTKNFFHNNVFYNAWSNSDWTLPSFGNLITGKYTSNHLCFKPETNYNDFSQINYNCEKNIFENFKDNNFITGCYSGYVRINPTYSSNKGVDIFKYCKNLDTSQVLDDVYAQIKLFQNTSNLIFCHLFDTHGPIKNENFTIKDFSFFDSKNYKFNQIFKEKEKGPKKMNDGHEEKKVIASLKQIDWHLFNFLENLKKEYLNTKIKDYSIIVFGDHGTRTSSNITLKNNNNLTRPINNISMMIMDSRYKKFDKNKLIETVDIFPSLLKRYKINSSKSHTNFDGRNTIFSKYKKKFQISESIYNKYDLILRSKKYFYEKSFTLKNNQIFDKNLDFFYNTNDKKIAHNKLKKTKHFDELRKNALTHLKKNKLIIKKLNDQKN